jgi:CBS domain-containing protein
MKLATMTVTRVSEVMSRPVITVPATETLAAAEHTLRTHRIGGAPVLGSAGQIVGVISLSDLSGATATERAEGSVMERTTRMLYGVRIDDPLSLALRLMAEQNIHRVLVLDDSATLVGILTPMDVVRHLLVHSGVTQRTDEHLGYVEITPHAQTPAASE